jgi:hypothetical protein
MAIRPEMFLLSMGVSFTPEFHCSQRALAKSSLQQAFVRDGRVLDCAFEDEGLWDP